MRDQETAVGLRQDVREVARAEPRVDRHEHRADLLDGKGDEDPLVAVVEPQGDVLAGPDPGGDQAPRRLVDARRNLAKRIARRPEHQPLAVGQAGRDVVRQIAEAAMPIASHGDQCTASSPAMGTLERPEPSRAKQAPCIVQATGVEIGLEQRERHKIVLRATAANSFVFARERFERVDRGGEISLLEGDETARQGGQVRTGG